MGAQKVNLAVIIKNRSNDDEFVLTKQNPPPKFNDPDYDSYQDSHLWDLPSVQLSTTVSSNQVRIQAEENSLSESLTQFDFDSAVNQVLGQAGLEKTIKVKWKLSKVVEEPEFGPTSPTKTVYIVGKLETHNGKLQDCCKWMSTKICAHLLLEARSGNDRIGPLVVTGLLNDSMQSLNLNIPPTLRYQEYPPGLKIVPMRSCTSKPFHTTNLVVFAPRNIYSEVSGDNFVASGDALIVDPGCYSTMHKELEQIITSLPRKLVVLVTHHHQDHVDGLPIVQKCNPDAILLAHENTFRRIVQKCSLDTILLDHENIFRRIKKDRWSLGYIPVLGSEEICIGGQRLRLISAPGHTDGHVAVHHVASNSLIVGDHCLGQGNVALDFTSGGNMTDYFRTTYNFIELSPDVIIPMHGRINMWPKHMLCGNLKYRRNKESSILKAIEDGANTVFDIIVRTHNVNDTDFLHRIIAASTVKLHIDHLALQNKLPKEFSMQRFQSSCKAVNFSTKCLWEYVCSKL